MVQGKSSITAREVEQGGVKQGGGHDRAKRNGGKLFVFLHYFIIFSFILICIKSVFVLGRSARTLGGAASQWKGLRPKMVEGAA